MSDFDSRVAIEMIVTLISIGIHSFDFSFVQFHSSEKTIDFPRLIGDGV